MQLLNIVACLLLAACISINTVKALKCYDCDSETDNDCIDNPAEVGPAALKKCSSKDTQCFTLMFRGSTVRGCKSDIPKECHANVYACNTKFCDISRCNKDKYTKPTSTLKCIQCEGKDCIQKKPKKCANYHEKDKCYTFANGTDNVKKGCLSDEGSPCRDGSCSTCTGDGCNNKTSRSSKHALKCIQCEGKDCVSVPEETPKKCANSRENDKCYTLSIAKDNVMRGCLSDEGSPCGDGSCSTCTGDGCNNKTSRSSKHALKCIQCEGKDCVSVPEETPKKCANSRENDECYTLSIAKDNVMRGCLSDEGSPCGDGSCSTCTGDGCNNKTSRSSKHALKCIQCEGKDCISVLEETPKKCANYRENDECYTIAIAKDNIMRGCLSDEGSPCGDVSCSTCTGDGCNNKTSRSSKHALKCIQCEGKDCISVPEETPKTCANYRENDECYTLAIAKDNVMRGCLSDEGSPCGDGSCSTCTGDGCNNETSRSSKHALKCIQCYGKDCVSVLKEQATECSNFHENDECYSFAIAKDNVMRGCVSDVGAPCVNGSCKKCKTDGCNNEIYHIPKQNLKCFQCSGKDCVSVFATPPTICKNYSEEDKCYTYVDNDENIFRGCASDEDSQCRDDFCVTCKTDGCNTNPPFIHFSCNVCQSNNQTCMKGSGRKGVCAVSTPRECKVLLGRQPVCFIYFKMNEFERGCGYGFNDGYEEKFIEYCFGENCNSKCVSNCYECNSEIDPECKNRPDKLEKKVCAGTNYCHECENEKGILIRACNKNQDKNQRCNNCHDINLCNKIIPITCIECSSEQDSACIGITDIFKMKTQQCDSIFDTCVSKINKTHIVRGCAKQFEPCDDAHRISCKNCRTDLCNRHLIPENRVFCHKCEDNTACARKQELQLPKTCQYDSEVTNKCFSVKTKNKVVRGCASEKEHDICNKDGNKCQYCNKPHGCNSDEFGMSFKCINCNDDNECGWAQIADSAVECKSDSMEPSCFTKIYENQTVVRGCLTIDIDEKNCFTCTGDACNTKAVFQQYCIKCDSTKNNDCIEGKEIPSTLCTTEETLFSESGCYTMSDGKNIVRGCATDLTEEAMQDCDSKDRKYCSLCRGQVCNSEKAITEGKSSVKCIKCSDAEQCPWEFSKDLAKECGDFLSKCFTYQYDNGTVIRGCGNDKTICDPEDEKCQICSKNGCNNENVVSHDCYKCQSDTKNQASCADKAQNITAIKCSGLQTFGNRGCYTKINNKIVSRGCILDLQEMELRTCNADKKERKCALCFESKCNNKEAPNRGSLLTHFSFVSFIIISGLIIM